MTDHIREVIISAIKNHLNPVDELCDYFAEKDSYLPRWKVAEIVIKYLDEDEEDE